VNQRRPYRSPRREQQAEQTRLLVLDAAERLFRERGYVGTSMAAVAVEAGVSPETVYGHFGSKRVLLGELFRRAVRGADPAPVPEQEVPRRLAAMTDQREQLRLFAADITPRLERGAPLVAVLAAAAQSDPELAELLTRLHADRRRNLRVLVDALAAGGALRLPVDDALDTVWALTSPELQQLLVRERGWTRQRYEEWLVASLAGLLLTS
jgi:TetR/AcrR family transcriptional regulator, regulator of autoinduction and epiphytic fitness